MATNEVVYENKGLDTLGADGRQMVTDVVEVTARAVEGEMKQLIIERDFVDTRATVNSVQVDPPVDPLVRDIGPTTHYAIYGELGYTQTSAWGHRLKSPIDHPGLHFAKDALERMSRPFIDAIYEVIKRRW